MAGSKSMVVDPLVETLKADLEERVGLLEISARGRLRGIRSRNRGCSQLPRKRGGNTVRPHNERRRKREMIEGGKEIFMEKVKA